VNEATDVHEGPAMAALNERQKRFVHALFLAPRSHGSRTFAAKAAGYGTPTSSRKSLSQIGHQLSADPKIQAAISEVSASYLTTLGPPAVRALKRLLDDPKHKDHGRALGIIMDRVAPQNSTHTVKVEHDVTRGAVATVAVLKRISELAAQAGLDVNKMPALIDAQPVKSERAA
jgi:phage terminase small subunit